jgi:opacity protein-like surface antigen
MRPLHTGALTALALVVGMTAQTANAQIVRAEIQGGVSQWHAAGDNDTSLGWGAAAGVDFDLGGFILGAEGTFWWPGACFSASDDCPAEVNTIDGAGLVHHKTFEEWGLAARLGMMVTPATLVYVKGGVVRNEQRKEFLPFAPGTTLPQGAGWPGYYYDHYKRGGWTAGAGVEHQISGPFYVKAEGRWSDYKRGQVSGGTHTITGLIGLGVKFGLAPPPAPLPPPPPPAAPPPPATQTCPDGTVILATEVCPAPPPPPPPPPPAPERG